MASLKQIASQALGLNGGFSLVRNFFGYQYYDSTQTFVAPLSLKNQMIRAKGKSIHLSIILVGLDASFGGMSVVTRAQCIAIQTAIQRMRDIYAQAPLGIRKLYWQRIGVNDAGGYINIADGSEATDLTDDWSGANDGIDVFFVQTIGDAAGWSNRDGPCDKDEACERTGADIEMRTDLDLFGVLVAHEVGHYLGLAGGVGSGNLMGSDVNNNGIDEIDSSSTAITASQASTMRSGCYVKAAL
jgi:hypothetical protein